MSKLFQGVRNLLLAALLLVCVICATEVGVRVMHWYQAVYGSGPAAQTTDTAIVVPGRETFLELQPLVSVDREIPETGEVIAFRTNSFGLRGPEIELPKPSGVFRILCLGDETTLGADVAEEQTYCQQLQQLLQPLTDLKVEVVNAGLPGGCPLTCELLLRHRLLGIQPDLILLHCDESDVADDRAARRFTRLDADGVPLAAIHPVVSGRAASPVTQLYQEFAVLDLARTWLVDSLDSRDGVDALTRTSLDRSPDVGQDGGDVTSADVDQAIARVPAMRDLARGIYCEFIVSTCPPPGGGIVSAASSGSQETRLVSNVEESQSSISGRLAELTREHEIAYMAAAADFAQPGQLYLNGSSLLSADGHARYARALARIIYDRVPGVWTRQPAPQETPGIAPLPGVARRPRE
jgi:hypothetical protein